MKHTVFSLSVDDGHPLDMRLAELLDKRGIPASFYIPIRNSEGFPVLQASQIRELAENFDVGSHTLDHRYLASLEMDEALRQITEGKVALEDILGKSIDGFCYPGGKYRSIHCGMVRAAGFRYARTTQNFRLDTGRKPLELPTSLQFYPHTRRVLLRNFLSQPFWRERWPLCELVLQDGDWLDRLRHLLAYALRQGGVFHLWCHSKDIDSLDLWQTLDDFLIEVSEWIPPDYRVDNLQLVLRYCEGIPPQLTKH
jgi:peptidoglycan/xylan/chitin deacetylase (PgdA/CDA1 family)